MLIASQSTREIQLLKQRLKAEFEMKELGKAKKILGMEISRDKQHRKIYLSQKSYLAKKLSRFGMSNAKAVSVRFASHFKLSSEQSPKDEKERKKMAHILYLSAVGSLMYGMVCKRLDLAHGMSVISRFMANPSKPHWLAIKWMCIYLKGSIDYALTYSGASLEDKPIILGYSNADYVANIEKCRSITGYAFRLWNFTIS